MVLKSMVMTPGKDHGMTDLIDEIAKSEFADRKIEFTEEPRTIIEKFILIDDKKYDLDGIMEDLDAIGDDIVFQSDAPNTKLFMEIGVLSYIGNSRWQTRAEPGPNFKEFYEMVKKVYYGKA